MLKRSIITLFIIRALTVYGTDVLAEGNPSVSVIVNNTSNRVTISGTVSDTSRWVTCFVESPSAYLEYVGDADVVNGEYAIEFGITHIEDGMYKIRIKAENEADTVSDTFSYTANPYTLRRAGIEYEQLRSTYSDLQAPDITNVHITILDFVNGIYRLELTDDDYSVDDRGTPFFFWASDSATFTDVSSDFRTVTVYSDPGTENLPVYITVGVGDGLGQVNKKNIILKGKSD